MNTDNAEEPLIVIHRPVISDRLWVVMKSMYMVLVHAVIIISLSLAISRHNACSQYMDGDLYAKRLFLKHDNGKSGVEIGVDHDGGSAIKLNDTQGRTRLAISTNKQESRIDIFSESGSQRATFGMFPNRENQTLLSLEGQHGAVVVGSGDRGLSFAIFDNENDIIAYIGCAAYGTPELMLYDKKSSLDLRAPSSDRPFGKRRNPWEIVPVSRKIP